MSPTQRITVEERVKEPCNSNWDLRGLNPFVDFRFSYNPTEIVEASKKVLKGEEAYVSGRTIFPLTSADLLIQECEREYKNKVGQYNQKTKTITINVPYLLGLEMPRLASIYTQRIISHEDAHAQFLDLEEIKRANIYLSFLLQEKFPKMKEVLIKNRPSYSRFSNMGLITELIAHAGERFFAKTTGKECFIDAFNSQDYEKMLDKISEDFFVLSKGEK